MPVRYTPFTEADYDEAVALWRRCKGLALGRADAREPIAAYLRRNPGFSFVARGEDGALAGAVLCGHDGRRGYLHHLAVAPSCRGCGIGRALVQLALDAVRAAGLEKCHIFVLAGNADGRRFWARAGWRERTDLVVMTADV